MPRVRTWPGVCRIAKRVARCLAPQASPQLRCSRSPLQAYILFGGVEPEADILGPEALRTLAAADLVVAITPYLTEQLKQIAHVVLPIGTFAETSGTYVNLEGLWQSFTAAARGFGESRPGWKVLRVLGTELRSRALRIPDLRRGSR